MKNLVLPIQKRTTLPKVNLAGAMNQKLALYALLLSCSVVRISGQPSHVETSSKSFNEAGLPFIQNYTPEEYSANPDNYAVVQDSLGILYFANGDGVLMYDGVHWDLVELPEKQFVISVGIDANNRVYVGAGGEIGYLEPDLFGKMHYVSLKGFLNDNEKNFTWVRNIHVSEGGVYFQERNYLFRWSEGKMKVWKSENLLLSSFLLDNTLYITVDGQGLMKLENDELKLVSDGAFFHDKRIGVLLPLDKKRLLIGTKDKLYSYENGKVEPFITELDDYISRSRLYSGIRLNNGNIALATVGEGIAVIDTKGKRQLLINKENSLSSLAARKIFQDKTGVLWVCFEYGISKIEFPSVFSQYGELGLSAGVYSIVRFKNELYVGSLNGLFRLKKGEDSTPFFERVKGLENTGISDFSVIDDMLLIAVDGGIYQMKDNEISSIDDYAGQGLLRSTLDSTRVFATMSDGIQSFRLQSKKLIKEGFIKGVKGAFNKIVEETNGDLWLSSSEAMVCRISFQNKQSAKTLQTPKIDKLTSENGLPNDKGYMHSVGNGIFFTSLDGKETYEFDRATNRFKPDETLNNTFGFPNTSIYLEYVDPNGNVLFGLKKETGPEKHYMAWKNDNGTYLVKDLKEERITEDIGWSWYVDAKDSVLWHGGKRGILRYDLKQKNNTDMGYNALITRVFYQNDSLISTGAYNSQSAELPHTNNSLRFAYAAPFFQNEKANTFSYLLEGFDKNWSNWSSETQKDYTNLPEGAYNFKVRAKNVYGQTSNEDGYTFSILPPWYRTLWAYSLYGLAFLFALWSFNRWRSQQLRTKNLALEILIDQRTEEIRGKNELLGQQTERLKEMDTMKTRLFANISHEFRTPLTLIKGPIEKLEESKKNELSTPNIKMIRRNADRLLNLVNQLLDLSKLESGKMQLDAAEGDVLKCIRAAASAFSSHAASRNIDYQIKVPSTSLWVSFDRDKLEKIVYNLLSNAFKFTDDEGRIGLVAEYVENMLHITVSDSGHGIEKDKLPYIFDRFYQVDSSYTKEKAGTGIGLALTKELVVLMNGAILVESELGKGSTFLMDIPLEKIESPQRLEMRTAVLGSFEESVNQSNNDAGTVVKKSSKVLIIEDNNDMRYFIKEQLLDIYEVFEAINGKEGLEKAAKLMPDLIITDLMMPQMDGLTLCKMLKTNISTSHIPIIMLTAKAGIENKIEGLETGADEYLTKPFNAKELLARSKNLIGQRQILRELFSKNISLDPKEITVTTLDEKFLNELLALLEERYSDPEFGVPQMQKQLVMSKTQLHLKVKALTNRPPGELLRNFRLKRAAQLLSKKGDNITQVAYSVGFNSLSYFTKCFKELYGSSPSEYISKGK